MTDDSEIKLVVREGMPGHRAQQRLEELESELVATKEHLFELYKAGQDLYQVLTDHFITGHFVELNRMKAWRDAVARIRAS